MHVKVPPLFVFQPFFLILTVRFFFSPAINFASAPPQRKSRMRRRLFFYPHLESRSHGGTMSLETKTKQYGVMYGKQWPHLSQQPHRDQSEFLKSLSCFQCGCEGHSRGFCPLAFCSNCRQFGHQTHLCASHVSDFSPFNEGATLIRSLFKNEPTPPHISPTPPNRDRALQLYSPQEALVSNRTPLCRDMSR